MRIGTPPRPRALAVAGSVLAALALYLPTMSHSIGFVDQGELAAVACTLGIAHPTGYPLLTLIARVWVASWALRPIVALDLLAALLTAASAGALAWLFDGILAGWLPPVARADTRRRAPGRPHTAPVAGTAIGDGPRALAAACAALATVATGTWWDQATGFEVYALHALMLPIVTGLFLRFARERRGGAAFALVLGLSFSNHMTTVLLAPAFLFLFARERRSTHRALAALPPLVPWFALGWTPYLALPLRSALGPRFDWGAPHTLTRLIAHVTAWQFRVWMFSEPDAFALQSRFFFTRLPGELAWLGLAVAAIGLAVMLARSPRLALVTLLLFGASVTWAGGFAIAEIRPYYLDAILAIGIAMAAGLGWIGGRFGTGVLAAVGLTLAVSVAAANWRASDAHDDRVVEDMTHDVLDPLPHDALVLSTEWDRWLSASFYLQEVEGLRRDVTVVDLELLRRSWYLDELARRAPWLADRVRAPLDHFRHEVAPFEAGRSYDPVVLEEAYHGLIAALAREAARDRAVFVTPEIDTRYTDGWSRVPVGLVERLTTGAGYVPEPAGAWRQRTRPAHLDVYTLGTVERYARSAAARAFYETASGHDSLAGAALDRARRYDPHAVLAQVPPQPYHGIEQVSEALTFFDRLRTLDRDGLRRIVAASPTPTR
ncbi:MAG: protein O-mannosyl-transferase family [Candidatus Eisenbacteria bacterium]